MHKGREALQQGLRMSAGIVLACTICTIVAPHALSAQVPAAGVTRGDARITGTVTDSSGAPIPGAQVTLVGTRFGAAVERNGGYTLAGVPAGSYELRVQRIGVTPGSRRITVAAGATLTENFILRVITTTLSTEVVVGYTTQQRRDVSDAVASVTGDEIRDQKVSTLDEALRGRIPGVAVNASGEPGRPAQVIIRGQNFVSGSTSPLYVVDGMYLGQNPNLNPADIESIEVLKDASAAAQYGAQAANGVVVIRTRRGTSGPNRIELRSYYGFQEVPKRIDMMNATQWGALTQQAYQNAGLPVPTGAVNPSISTDWQDAVFQRGAIQDHNISVLGGTPTASYLVTGGVLDQQGAIIETGFRRYNFRVNSEFRRGRLTVGENLALSQGRRQGLSGFPLIDVVRMLPSIAVRDPANPGGWGYGSDANPTFGTNPVAQQETRSARNRSNQIIGSVFAEVGLFANLKYRFNLGLNYDDFASSNFNSIAQLRYRTPVPVATLNEFRSNFTSLLYENLLAYDGTYGEGRHRLNAVAGVTEQQQTLNSLTAYREGFTDENLTTINSGQVSNLNNSGAITRSSLRALLLRANYTFADRYILSGSARRDGSSRFGPGNRYANFAAGSVGWLLSEEGWFDNLPLIGKAELFKLRASTGVLGNQDIGDYQFAAPIQQNLNYLLGNSSVNGGAIQLSLSNPNIKWQSNRQTNVGLDWGLGNRGGTTFTIDWYRSESEGLLVNAPLPWSLGATGSPVVNAGSVRNSGLELGVRHGFGIADATFNISANLTTQRNKVLSLGNGGQPLFDNLGVARTTVGGAIGEFYVLQTDGIFQSAQEVTQHAAQPNAQPGDVRFVDRNNDGLINLDDRYDAGNGLPKLIGGLFLDGKWRSFDFGVNLRGQSGNKIFNAVRFWTDRGDDPSNFRAGYTPWTPTNTATNTPRVIAGPAGAQNATFLSDRWLEDGSFLRVQNIVLGYTLPASLSRTLGAGAMRPRVYLNVQNVGTFTNFTNWDPETLGFGNPLGRGIDDGAIFPNVRTISFGIDFRL